MIHSPRVRCLLTSLSSEARNSIVNAGIVSVLETNAWDTAAEFATHVSLEACLQIELQAFWLAAQGACAVAARRAVRAFAEAPGSQQRPLMQQQFPGLKFSPTAQSASAQPSQPVMLKRQRLQAAPANEAQQHLQNLQLVERRAVEAAVAELWSLFLELGASGSLWQDYAQLGPCEQEQFASMFSEDMCMVAPSTLQGALRLVRRWRRHCEECKIEPWTPSGIHVALWLRSLKERGPTAPHGAFTTLQWLEKKLGINFHTSSDRVRGQSAVPQSHLETQAVPLSLKLILGLESLVGSRNHAVSALALTWLLLTFAVLRFAHLQRSVILRVLDNSIAAKASLGKRRTQGRRRPFEWRAPRWGITGGDLGAAVHEQLARSFGGQAQPGFFLPDFSPPRCNVHTATGFSAKPMSLGRFSRLSQQMFQQAPFHLSDVEACTLTSYSARRVLPTVAELARFDPHEMLLVGDWKGARGACPDLSMPLRYADQKLHTSLAIKTELVCIMNFVYYHGSPNSPWAELSEHFPPREDSRQQAVQVLRNGRAAIYMPEEAAGTAPAAEDDSSSSASSSTSDSDSASSLSTEVEKSNELQWLLSKGRRGHLHICKPLQLQTKRWHTHCNRGLRDPEVGLGLEDAFSTGRPWSPRCFSNLPTELQRAWEALGHNGR